MRSITKIIIMFVVIFFFNERNILGQNTFFKWNATSTYEYIYSLTYLIDNSFLLAGYGGSESGNYRAFLLHLDQNGNEINRRFSTEDTVESLYTIPFFIHDSLFILKTVYSNVDDKVFENLCFCNIFIADLNSQVRKKYQFNANHFRLPQEVCNIDDNIYVLYLQDHNSSNETKGRGYSITKYNQAFNTVNSYYDTNYSIVAGGFGLVRNS